MKRFLLIVLMLLWSCQLALPVEVQECKLGFDGMYRAGEWTPLTLKFDSVVSGSLRVTVNGHIDFVKKHSGETASMIVLLPKTTSNSINIYLDDKLLLSSLSVDDQARFRMQALPHYFRLLGLLLPSADESVLPESVLHDLLANRIKVFVLDAGLLEQRAEFLESVDHIVSSSFFVESLSAQSQDTLKQWQIDGGLLSDIDSAKGGRLAFMNELVETEAHRQRRHKSTAYDAQAYNIFAWPDYSPAFRKQLTGLAFVLVLIIILLLWAVPARRYGRSLVCLCVLWGAVLGLIVYGIPAVSSASDYRFLSESLALVELTDTALVHDDYTSVSPKRKDVILTGTSKLPVKSIFYEQTLPKELRYTMNRDANRLVLTSFPETLQFGRRHLYLQRWTEVKGEQLSIRYMKDQLELKNLSEHDFDVCFLVRYGKLYALNPLQDGGFRVETIDRPVAWGQAFDSASKDARYRKRLLDYWRQHRMDPKRISWLGFCKISSRQGLFIEQSATMQNELWYSDLDE